MIIKNYATFMNEDFFALPSKGFESLNADDLETGLKKTDVFIAYLCLSGL